MDTNFYLFIFFFESSISGDLNQFLMNSHATGRKVRSFCRNLSAIELSNPKKRRNYLVVSNRLPVVSWMLHLVASSWDLDFVVKLIFSHRKSELHFPREFWFMLGSVAVKSPQTGSVPSFSANLPRFFAWHRRPFRFSVYQFR